MFVVLATGKPIAVSGPIKPLTWQAKNMAGQEFEGEGGCVFARPQVEESMMVEMLHDPQVLPDDLPVPQDDGAARHLAGMRLPDIALAATDGAQVNLSKLNGRTIVYVYPRTGRPGQALPTGWNAIPGARGCTPQSCGFRDHFAELKRLGVAALYGLPLAPPPGVEPGAPGVDAVNIAVDDIVGCPRYIGRIFRDVKIGPSPAFSSKCA